MTDTTLSLRNGLEEYYKYGNNGYMNPQHVTRFVTGAIIQQSLENVSMTKAERKEERLTEKRGSRREKRGEGGEREGRGRLSTFKFSFFLLLFFLLLSFAHDCATNDLL